MPTAPDATDILYGPVSRSEDTACYFAAVPGLSVPDPKDQAVTPWKYRLCKEIYRQEQALSYTLYVERLFSGTIKEGVNTKLIVVDRTFEKDHPIADDFIIWCGDKDQQLIKVDEEPTVKRTISGSGRELALGLHLSKNRLRQIVLYSHSAPTIDGKYFDDLLLDDHYNLFRFV